MIHLVRDATGVDFTQYKPSTLLRRIARRMMLHKIEAARDYVALLQNTPREVSALFSEILINVTSFFRDPDAWEALREKVFPAMFARSREEPVRVWTLGCSTGEEAYSLAIAITEYQESAGRSLPVQIFASDVNPIGIDRARQGI